VVRRDEVVVRGQDGGIEWRDRSVRTKKRRSRTGEMERMRGWANREVAVVCASGGSDQVEATGARCACVKVGRGSGLVCVRLSISCCAVLSAGGGKGREDSGWIRRRDRTAREIVKGQPVTPT